MKDKAAAVRSKKQEMRNKYSASAGREGLERKWNRLKLGLFPT